MPGGDNNNSKPPQGWLFPLIGLLLALSIAWGIGYLQARDTERRQKTPAAYSQAAKKDALRTCGGRELGASFECNYEKVEASQEQARAEQDLSAQQRAADSALASAFIALLTLIITATGVWFVKRTLDATWKAVEDTSEATDAMREANKLALISTETHLRPWIEATIGPPYRFLMVDSVHNFRAEIKIKNVGQTPALNVSYFACLVCGPDPKSHIDETVDLYLQGKIDWEDANLFPDREVCHLAASDAFGLDAPVAEARFYVVAIYRTRFSQRLRYTASLYDITDRRRGDRLIDFNDTPFREDISVKPSRAFIGYVT